MVFANFRIAAEQKRDKLYVMLYLWSQGFGGINAFEIFYGALNMLLKEQYLNKLSLEEEKVYNGPLT